MKPILTALALLSSIPSFSQTSQASLNDSLNSRGLNHKYQLASFIKPSNLQVDLDGDGKDELAIPVIEKTTKKTGIIIFQGQSKQYFVFGAGKKLDKAPDDFTGISKWSIYRSKYAWRLIYQKIDQAKEKEIGGKKIELKHPCISFSITDHNKEIFKRLIYWSGTNYIWLDVPISPKATKAFPYGRTNSMQKEEREGRSTWNTVK